MDDKQTSSQMEDEQDSKHDTMHTNEKSTNWKPESRRVIEDVDHIAITIDIDSQDICEEPQSSQQNDVQRRDINEGRHSQIDLLTFTADYETIKELQKKAQPNINYFLALQSLINSKQFSSESLQLKRQSVTIENADGGILNKEKQLLNRNIDFPADLTFQQRLKAYCMAAPIQLESGLSSFDDKYTRHEFIRKVFALLFICLAFTTAFIAVFAFAQPVRMYFRENIGVSIILMYTTLGFAVFLMCLVSCVPSLARSFPSNLFVLALFVLFYTVSCGILAALHSEHAVLMAAGLTVLIVAIISLFAIQTRWDVTGCGFILFIASIAFSFAGFIFFLVYWLTGLVAMYIIYCGLGVALFSVYLMYDIQLIMGGRRYQISEEDYMPAVVMLYIDILGMFVYLLGLSDLSG
ncbi:protein lifeguard 3-like [Agrilus planipennis]|uniref:Protein lifeguard 3-like n=1 Tax=Agrilus planipennis TaxID=224129 RepID=A0A1W4XE41_AGRPL|nr:protein lifeguard 3-like [Agrilus planipennis]XP_018334401.1 protein lifeguard 3-like [Agrilus planipennis]